MSKAPTHLNDHSNEKLTAKDLYEQGSKCCQQYSQLTMQVRTLAQHIMIAYAVGMGIFLASRGPSAPPAGFVFFGAGIILIVFAWVLCILNLHHSFAFRAIRDDCLISLEKASGVNIKGPWQAHEGQRSADWLSTDLAWYGPFVAIGVIGVISIGLGAWLTRSVILISITAAITGFAMFKIGRPAVRKYLRQKKLAKARMTEAE